MEIQILKSNKGKDKLNIDGFMYNFERRTSSLTYNWACEKRKSHNCKSRVVTIKENAQHKVIKGPLEHFHEPFATSKYISFANAILTEKAKTTHQGPSQIIRDVFKDENPCNSQPVLKKEHDTVVVPSQRNYQKDYIEEVYPKEDVNDARIMAKGWSIQYAELSNRQRVLARKIISDVLFHGCLGHLTENSVQEVQNIFDPPQRITSPEEIFLNSCNSSEFI